MSEQMALRSLKLDTLPRKFSGVDDGEPLDDRGTRRRRPTKEDDSTKADILQARVGALKMKAHGEKV